MNYRKILGLLLPLILLALSFSAREIQAQNTTVLIPGKVVSFGSDFIELEVIDPTSGLPIVKRLVKDPAAPIVDANDQPTTSLPAVGDFVECTGELQADQSVKIIKIKIMSSTTPPPDGGTPPPDGGGTVPTPGSPVEVSGKISQLGSNQFIL